MDTVHIKGCIHSVWAATNKPGKRDSLLFINIIYYCLKIFLTFYTCLLTSAGNLQNKETARKG